ncbi:MAG: DNA polymerase ligase N-terminal domain-containing protein [Desulfobacterales bacterium]
MNWTYFPERMLGSSVLDRPLLNKNGDAVGNVEDLIIEYGAGTVLVWDTGPYRNLRLEKKDDGRSMAESHTDGKIEVWLEGRKIKGGYALIRTGNDDRWLLVKMDDDEADARRNPVSTEPKSVLSGRTLEQIAEKEGG